MHFVDLPLGERHANTYKAFQNDDTYDEGVAHLPPNPLLSYLWQGGDPG